MPYHETREQYCPNCGKTVTARKLSPTLIKCPECGQHLKMRQKDKIDIILGTFGAHRRG